MSIERLFRDAINQQSATAIALRFGIPLAPTIVMTVFAVVTALFRSDVAKGRKQVGAASPD